MNCNAFAGVPVFRSLRSRQPAVLQQMISRLERNDLRWTTLPQLRRVAQAVHCTSRIKFVDARGKRHGSQQVQLPDQDLRSSGRLSRTLDSPVWSRGGQAVGRCQPWRMAM